MMKKMKIKQKKGSHQHKRKKKKISGKNFIIDEAG
jgi:hypothetical protein